MIRLNAVALGVLSALVTVGAIAQAAPPLGPTDKLFVTQAVQGGMAEVADAQLALKKSKDPAVLTFARRMISDHGAADAKLAAILARQGIDAPKTVGPANVLTHGKLNVLTGDSFNSAYLKAQRKGHESMISLLRQEIASGRDPELVAFARATMPTVMAHLAMLNSRSSM